MFAPRIQPDSTSFCTPGTPISDICLINLDNKDPVPPQYELLERTPGGLALGLFAASGVQYGLCYRRMVQDDEQPISDIQGKAFTHLGGLFSMPLNFLSRPHFRLILIDEPRRTLSCSFSSSFRARAVWLHGA